jgi:bisanhydrobacterioruberin hydratase
MKNFNALVNNRILTTSVMVFLTIIYIGGVVNIGILKKTEMMSMTWGILLFGSLLSLAFYGDYFKSIWPKLFLVFAISMLAEILGVQYGIFFGDYYYGQDLGIKLFGVPMLIGILWLTLSLGVKQLLIKMKFPKYITLVLGGLLLVFVDYIMEPFAVNFNLWIWKNDVIPIYNYTCWFVLGVIVQWIIFDVKAKNIMMLFVLILNVLFFIIMNILF